MENKKYRILKLLCIYIAAIVLGLILAILSDDTNFYATAFYLVIIVGLYIYIYIKKILCGNLGLEKCIKKD